MADGDGTVQVHQLTEATLRALSEVEAAEPVVVSAFLALDAAERARPAARESRVRSLLAALDEEIREGDLSDDAREALGADRDQIADFLEGDLDVGTAEAIAIYSASALDLFHVVGLTEPVESGVRVDLRPILEPVLGHEDDDRWCVLLVTRETGRLFRGGPTGLREIREVRSTVKGQHKAGGWSQGRFERGVQQEVEWHLEKVTDLLHRHARRRPFDHLVVGANDEALRPALTGETHAELLERVRGWVDIDERNATADEVLVAVRGIMDEHAAAEERELLERYAAERGTNGRAATGVAEVLAALAEQRVEMLIVVEGAEAEGTKCVTCGWMGTEGLELCAVDGTRLDPIANILEPAIQAAVQQSAAVHIARGIGGRDEARELPFDEPVAAVLRF